MDAITRIICGWQIGFGMELTLGAPEQALSKGAPEIHRSDQGPQYAATDYTARLLECRAPICKAYQERSCRRMPPSLTMSSTRYGTPR